MKIQIRFVKVVLLIFVFCGLAPAVFAQETTGNKPGSKGRYDGPSTKLVVSTDAKEFLVQVDATPDPVVIPQLAIANEEEVCIEVAASMPVAGRSSFAPPNSLLMSLGARTDFSLTDSEESGGCRSCGGNAIPLNNENLLHISRKMIPSNQATIGNSSPGVYFNFDYRVEFYQDSAGRNLALLFDPESEKVFYYEYETSSSGYVCKIDINGKRLADSSHFGKLTLENVEGGIVTDPRQIDKQAVFAVIRRRNGWEYRFDVVDVKADASDDPELMGRLLKITQPHQPSHRFYLSVQTGRSRTPRRRPKKFCNSVP